jgi:hypothetical protein
MSALLVCKPVASGAASVPSFEDFCSQCQRPVWRAFSSPADPPAICYVCARERIAMAPADEVEFEPISPAQLDDILSAIFRSRN